ncbi:DUF3853 family protein [Dysgonomonas massiliensis]|uniref:DUF3853 family protein n=1 Tax=Dysgonomonas massiliensis TaxID=2040292 RepID=UPI000C772B4D|nr:DUF3853 family protein [Dysgonomonas massiliensis]
MELQQLQQKRAIDLTAGELAKVLASELSVTQNLSKESSSYSFKGIKGIMEIFQCSKSKAMGIRTSGVIDEACIQNGNSFLIDRDLALALMRDKTSYKTYKRQKA